MNKINTQDDEANLSPEPLWTVEEMAAYLKLQPETIRTMARRGELPALKIGKVWRFQQRAIHDMLTNLWNSMINEYDLFACCDQTTKSR